MRRKKQQPLQDLDMSRRGFIKSVATLAGAAAVSRGAVAEETAGPESAADQPQMLPVALDVNGRRQRLLVEPRWTLLYVLRDRLGLTGTKPGCERGECGACTVLMDGIPRYSCMTLALEAQGARITTIEGLMQGENLGTVQEAFAEADAFQCGYCTPGQVMAVEGLLRNSPSPGPEQVRDGVSGNLCRCGAYAHIFKAAQLAAEKKRQGGR
jgi:xanthine dehydrogenase YagT iron-sulfur-binding subunit